MAFNCCYMCGKPAEHMEYSLVRKNNILIRFSCEMHKNANQICLSDNKLINSEEIKQIYNKHNYYIKPELLMLIIMIQLKLYSKEDLENFMCNLKVIYEELHSELCEKNLNRISENINKGYISNI